VKYFVDIVDKAFLVENCSNAASKPRVDTTTTLTEAGYQPILEPLRWWIPGCPTSLKQKVWRKLHLAQMGWCYRRLKRRLKAGDEVVMQYPFLVPEAKALMVAVKECRAKLTILIHDCYLLREHRQQDATEQWILKFADKVIAHSEQMARFFVEISKQIAPKEKMPEMAVLEMFDYRLKGPTPTLPLEEGVDTTWRVMFAGNLSKAGFVKELGQLPVKFCLYGLPKLDSASYKGAFDGNSPEGLEGDFGLVWDGNSLDTCTGMLGEYLRFNAPFKLSLYLALGLPVIVWSQSAMATYVMQYHLGICVDSLHELAPKLAALSQEDLAEIKVCVAQMVSKIRSGAMLKKVINTTACE